LSFGISANHSRGKTALADWRCNRRCSSSSNIDATRDGNGPLDADFSADAAKLFARNSYPRGTGTEHARVDARASRVRTADSQNETQFRVRFELPAIRPHQDTAAAVLAEVPPFG
jgi:hypothetical protein